MTLREIFNGILDANLEALFWNIVGTVSFIFWTVIVTRFFWHLNRHVNNWWKKINPIQTKPEDSLVNSLLKFFPELILIMLPSAIVVLFWTFIWIAPIFWIVANI